MFLEVISNFSTAYLLCGRESTVRFWFDGNRLRCFVWLHRHMFDSRFCKVCIGGIAHPWYAPICKRNLPSIYTLLSESHYIFIMALQFPKCFSQDFVSIVFSLISLLFFSSEYFYLNKFWQIAVLRKCFNLPVLVVRVKKMLFLHIYLVWFNLNILSCVICVFHILEPLVKGNLLSILVHSCGTPYH